MRSMNSYFHSALIFTLFLHTNLLCADLCWQNLPQLTGTNTPPDSSVCAYLNRYGLDSIGTTPIIGTFTSDSFICVGQIYRPKEHNSRGTVILLHGLFNHVGTAKNGIAACLRENFTVAAFDLPGHGLSSGIGGRIGDFNEYASALHSFLNACDTLTNPPFIFIGHSAGCAVALQYVISTPDHPFSKLIFLAPLLRSSSFRLSSLGYKLFHRAQTMPRRWSKKSSHDKESLKNFRNDPLQPATFSMQWAGAYFRWYNSIEYLPQQKLPLLIIQGTEDNVVDWKYNLRWFTQKIHGLEVVKIEGARHNLFNESQEYWEPCKNTIQTHIKNLVNQH